MNHMFSDHFILSLTLQKQIGLSQPLQPSRQSVWHGHAEFQLNNSFNNSLNNLCNFKTLIISVITLNYCWETFVKRTIIAGNRVSIAIQHAIAITTSWNAIYKYIITFRCANQAQIVIAKYRKIKLDVLNIVKFIRSSLSSDLRAVWINKYRRRGPCKLKNRPKETLKSHSLWRMVTK